MTTENTPPVTPPVVEPAPATPPSPPPSEASPESTPPATPPADKPAPAADKPAAAEWTPYEIAPPEGVEVNANELKAFTEFANELKIPKEKAEAFSHQFAQKQLEAVQTTIAKWREESEADPELGGANYEQNVGIAKKALNKFGDAETISVLEKTGLGNHKGIVRMLLRVGKAMSDDVVATQNAAAPKAEPTFASALMSVAKGNK